MRPAQAAEAPEAVASTSCGAPATPEGGAAGVVGFLFSEKKRRSLLTQEFVERARCVAHRAPAAASAPRRRRLARSHAGTAHLRGWGAGVR